MIIITYRTKKISGALPAKPPSPAAAFGGSPLTCGLRATRSGHTPPPAARVLRSRRCLGCQPMWRCTSSALVGPGSAAATHGPGIDGSMMPSVSLGARPADPPVRGEW